MNVSPATGFSETIGAISASNSSINALNFGTITSVAISSNFCCITSVERFGVSGKPTTPLFAKSLLVIFAS